jgi:hypothetical protein
MRNPHFGKWRGESLGAALELPDRARPPDPPCPGCGKRVSWEVERGGRTVCLEGVSIHVCRLPEVLRRHGHRDGSEVLAELRRAINERRMYGEAV